MDHLPVALALLLFLLVYFNPMIAAGIWLSRLFGHAHAAAGSIRQEHLLLWGQMLLSAALAVFWTFAFAFSSPHVTRDVELRLFGAISLVLAAMALVGGIIGVGPAKKWTILSALLVPLNWYFAAVIMTMQTR